MEDKKIAITNSDVFYRCLDITEYMWDRQNHMPTLRNLFDNAYEMYCDLTFGGADQYLDALEDELNNVTDYYDKAQIQEYIDFVKKVNGKVEEYEEE